MIPTCICNKRQILTNRAGSKNQKSNSLSTLIHIPACQLRILTQNTKPAAKSNIRGSPTAAVNAVINTTN